MRDLFFTRHKLRRLFMLAALLLTLSGNTALAQSSDPCLDLLSEADLERYDALVESYFLATEEGDTARQIELLSQLRATCDANLRLQVLIGDAQQEQGLCEAASASYFEVIDQSPDWPFPDNAADARSEAEAGLDTLREICLAQVSVACGEGAQLIIGDRTALQCPAETEVPAGSYPLVISQSGFYPIKRNYTFKRGSNIVEVEALRPIEDGGTVVFACDEPAEILLGDERFSCPAERILPAGRHTFNAYRPDQEVFIGEVEVISFETKHYELPSFNGAKGTLVVNCQPESTQVVVQGRAYTNAQSCPFSLPLPEGQYQVGFAAQGYEPFTTYIAIQGNKTTTLSQKLKREGTNSFIVTLLGGVGVHAKRDAQIDGGTQEVDGPTTVTLLGEFILPLLDEGLSISLPLRLGFGGGVLGVSVGGLVKWGMSLGDVDLQIGGGIAYGKLGDPQCPADEDCTSSAQEGEGAGLYYAGMADISYALSPTWGIKLATLVAIKERFHVDILAGLSYGF